MTDATADSSSIFTRKPRKGYPAQKSTENEKISEEMTDATDDWDEISRIDPSVFTSEPHEKRTKGRGEIYYLPLYKAALQGKWEDAEKIIKDDKNAMVAEVSSAKETALHIAASTGRRSIKFVERLVDSMDKDLLGQPDKDGDTPLHYAALVGNTEAATILVEKNPALLHKTNNNGLTPLHAAVMSGQEKIVCDILKMTSVEDPCFTGQAGVKLLNLLITADFYEIAFQLLKRNPSLALKTDKEGLTALRKLALKPGAFKSRSQKGNCWSLFNHFFSGIACRSSYPQGGDVENAIGSSEKGLTSPTIVKKMSKHTQALKLLRLLIDETLKVDNASKVRRLLLPPVRLAARWGIHEFVAEPSDKVSGAALQMQRELQWFQEVEKVVQPSYKEMKNRKGKTPRMVFTEEHKDLLKQGEKWMKGTASSCTVVAALVVTVAFAAAFTVPGGNTSDQGIPIYLNEAAFLIFAISNAFALFSSSTSLLMFLGILTSRYSEYDFLKALPMRMSIGLISLFFSIVSMLVAFGSSLQIVLSHRVNWIWVPISLLACVPVTLFAILQFPLLVEIVSSTFGPGIFRKRNDEIIM
ncbi:hypothetical protein P3X46_001606 [Hevea brasiliensis]|uniref:PGG domain-containing protein n=1 Tax=Hevea brasiliensis TaxID=3981 RepID=A0ABQ9ND61_HEVBR|nr:hypothetical protein P3X46_001606 [Hevea brasiliensis]